MSTQKMSREQTVIALQSVYKLLEEDVSYAQALRKENDTQFTRRTLVRTYFAFIEGLTYNMRQVTLASLMGTKFLTVAELSLLREERYSLNDKGQVKVPQESFLNTCPAFLFSLRMFAKCHGATFDPELGDGGWEAFKKASEFRNRITHPKSVERIIASDNDIINFNKAAAWSIAVLNKMFDMCNAADEHYYHQSKTLDN